MIRKPKSSQMLDSYLSSLCGGSDSTDMVGSSMSPLALRHLSGEINGGRILKLIYLGDGLSSVTVSEASN